VDDPAARVPRGGPPLGAAIRHRLITIVVTVAIASGLAGFYVAGLQSTYTSILLRPAPGNPLSPDNASGSGSQLAVAMDTEARLATPIAQLPPMYANTGTATHPANRVISTCTALSLPGNRPNRCVTLLSLYYL